MRALVNQRHRLIELRLYDVYVEFRDQPLCRTFLVCITFIVDPAEVRDVAGGRAPVHAPFPVVIHAVVQVPGHEFGATIGRVKVDATGGTVKILAEESATKLCPFRLARRQRCHVDPLRVEQIVKSVCPGPDGIVRNDPFHGDPRARPRPILF